MSQNTQLLAWFQANKSIEPMQALRLKPGIYRLAARICELKNKGHNIVNTEPNGKPARYVYLGGPK